MFANNPPLRRLTLALGSLSLAALSTPTLAAQAQVKVIVENLAPTNSVSFAPLRVGFHSGVFDPFNIGEAAGPEIMAIAEMGSDAFWAPAFQAADPTATIGSVLPVPLTPGASSSETFVVDTALNHYFSFGAMVVPSNDFFIGNDDPTAYQLFDQNGHLQVSSITLRARDIWDAGTEVHDVQAAAFIAGGNGADRADQDSVVAFNFGEFAAYNGLTTAAGYTFDSQLSANSDVYRISFEVSPVPEPETYAMLLAGLGLVGLATRRRRPAYNRVG